MMKTQDVIAWKLRDDFNAHRHLFYNTIDTDYMIEVYLCGCGHKEFVITYEGQEIDFTCKVCENSYFYDANSAWYSMDRFLHNNSDIPLLYTYEIIHTDNIIEVRYLSKIPYTIHFLTQSVSYRHSVISKLTLDLESGKLDRSYTATLGKELKVTDGLTTKLVEYVHKNSILEVVGIKSVSLTLSMITFFLENKHLKLVDFFYWDGVEMLEVDGANIQHALHTIAYFPKARSVKKALYQNYMYQLETYGRFSSSFISLFCKHIKDVNLLTKLLHVRVDHVNYGAIEDECLEALLLFLKRHYSEKQIYALFSSEAFDTHFHLFVDAVKEFIYVIDKIDELFKKVSCSVVALHDEFVRCSQEQRYIEINNKTLFYTQADKKACISIDTYEVKLPATGKELYIWADTLHNCMAGYMEEIAQNRTRIYGFFSEGILTFAVEVQEGEIVQASGVCNRGLRESEKKVLLRWSRLFFNKMD